MVKLNTECIFEFNDRFLTRVDGCTIGGPLSLLVKFMDILIPSKSLRKKKYNLWRSSSFKKKMDKDHGDESPTISPNLFGITKLFISIKIKTFLKEISPSH